MTRTAEEIVARWRKYSAKWRARNRQHIKDYNRWYYKNVTSKRRKKAKNGHTP